LSREGYFISGVTTAFLKHDGTIPWDNDILTNLVKEGSIMSMFSLIRKVGQGSRE
jgi:hypothetical protein